MKYSILIPTFNEAESLPSLIGELSKVMNKKDHEIIIINDGSTDKTRQVLAKLKKDKLVVLHQIRNGKWHALREGIKNAKGEIIVTMDADLQDNPEDLKKLLLHARKFDIVSGWRKERQDSFYKVLISKLGSRLLGFEDLNSSFKLYHRQVLDQLPKDGSLLRFSLLFAKDLGFKVIEIPLSHRKRQFGKSKFGLEKYLRILYDLALIKLLFTGSGRISK